MLRMNSEPHVPCNWLWRLWAIWLISIDPASAVSLVNGTLGGSIDFYQLVYWNAPLEWRFGVLGDDAVVAVRPFYDSPYCYPNYRGRCKLSNEGALRLNNLTYADQGQYVFIVGAIHPYSSQTVYFQLQIFPPLGVPILILHSNEHIVSGSNVTFHCDGGDQNITSYIFYRNGNNICSDPRVTCRDSYLYFQPIRESDSGSYTCAIQNPASSNYSNALLVTVSATLTAPALIPNSARDYLVNGTYVSLHCDAGKQNVATYTFSRNGKNICSEPHVTCMDSNLHFQSVTQNDSGRYTCTIQNPISSSTSNTLQLRVLAPATSVELTSNPSGWVWEGESVSLHCTTSLTDVMFVWHVNGGLLPGTDRYNITSDPSKTNSTLTISPLIINDSGSYTCVTSHPTLSETSNALNLSVAKSPDSSNIYCGGEAFPGGVVLTCSWPGGKPAAEIQLSFNGTVINGSDVVNQSVNVGNEVQQPVLACQGNQVGKISTCNKTFERPLSTSHDNNVKTSVADRENATLTVSLTSENSLIVEFIWFRLNPDSVTITDSGKYKVTNNATHSTLLISSVTGSDSGTYECKARNVFGSTTFKFNVEVKSQGSSGLSGGAIAGIVIGVIVGVVLIGVGVFFLVKKLK